MKLHLPKLLRSAVLACFASVAGIATSTVGSASLAGSALLAFASHASALESATVTTLQTLGLGENWSVPVIVGNSSTQVTYDASTGVISGYNAANGLDVTMSVTWETASQLAYVGAGSASNPAFGLNAQADGSIIGMWDNNDTDSTVFGNYGSDTITAEKLTELKDDSGQVKITITLSGTTGTKVTAAGVDEPLFNLGNLKSGSTNTSSVYVNKDIITGITFSVEGDTTYTSNGVSVTKAQGEHVNITAGEVMYTGGESGSAVGVSTAGNPLFVGGAGLLFLQTWGAGNIELNNDIYLGSSTHANAGTRGVIDFGNDASGGYATTLGGNIYVLEDTSWRARGTNAVNINGTVTDKVNIDGSASEGGKTLTVKGGGYNISGDVSLGNLALVGGTVVLNGATNTLGSLAADVASKLTIGDSASLSVSGAVSTKNTIVNNGTISLGGLMTVESLKEVDYEYENSSLSNATHGFRTGKTHYYLVKGDDSSSVQLGSGYALNAGGVDIDSSSYKVEGGNLIYTHEGTGTIYEIQDGCTETISYDAATGDTAGATGFLMGAGTVLEIGGSTTALTDNIEVIGEGVTISLKGSDVSLNLANVVQEAGSSVSFEVDGGSIVLDNAQTAKNISLSNGASLSLNNGASLSAESIALSGGSVIAMRNGNGGQILDADITVDGTGYIAGSMNGNNSNVRGSISGTGVLGLVKDQQWSNSWTVSALISDGAEGPLAVQVSGGKLEGGAPVAEGGNNVTLSGANTYTGGTTVNGGTLTVTNPDALGTGAVTVNGGTLNINTNLKLSQLLTVGAGGTVTVAAQNASVVLSSLRSFEAVGGSTTIPTTNGSVDLGKIKVLDAAEGATLNNLSSVVCSGATYTLDADGCISPDGKIYYVVEADKPVTVGGDAPTEGLDGVKEFYVGENGTLVLANVPSAVGKYTLPAVITGSGTVEITFYGGGGHDSYVDMSSDFTGTLQINGGNMRLPQFNLAPDVTMALVAGEHWNGGDCSILNDIILSDTKGAYVFRNNETTTLAGKVTGQYLDVGTAGNNVGTVKLTHSETNIGEVTVGTSGRKYNLTVGADMTFGIITAVHAESTVTLESGVTLTLGDGETEAASSLTNLNIGTGECGVVVQDKATLAVGTMGGEGSFTKGGAGSMTVTGTVAATSVAVQGGTLSLTGTNALSSTAALDIATGATLSSASDMTVATVDNAGTLEVGGALAAVVTNSGTLKAASISGGSFSSTGGSIELTGTDASIAATDISISGTTLKGTWSAAGAELGSGVVVDTTGNITLEGATLGAAVANNGTLKLTGTTTLGMAGADGGISYTDGRNAYQCTNTVYSVLSSGALADGSSNTWNVGGETVTQELDTNGNLIINKTDYTTYWVQEGTVQASSIDNAGTTTVALNGGILRIDEACDKDITVSAESSIIIVENKTLSKSQLSGEGAASLSGEGTYDLGSDLTLGANATLADTWAGKVTSAATEVTADTELALGSKVELTATKLTLGAELTQVGELILDASELAFSTFEASLNADTLVLGGDLGISIDKSTLEGAAEISASLIKLTNATTAKLTYGGTEITETGLAILEDIGKDGMYDAKLAWNGKALTLSTTVKEGVLVWNESESTDFGDTTKWDTTTITTEGKDVAFTGSCSDGSGTVEITGGTAKVQNVIIANHGTDDAQDYTFTGESIVAAGNLSVGDGTTLTVSNDMTVGGEVTVSDSSALVVNGGSLEVTTGNVNASQGAVNVTAGTLTVGGALDAVSITNAGTLEVKGAAGAVAGDVENTGTLTVTEDLSVATLDNQNELTAANVAATSITNAGTLKVSGVVTASAPTTFGLRSLPVGGEIVNTGDMTVGGVDAAKFTMTGGTLEITSAAGFKSGATEITGGTLKAGTVDWGIDGGSIGGVTIEGEKTLSLNDVKLTAALTNNGNLSLGGTIDVTGLTGEDKSVYTDLDGSMSADGNGYTAQTTLYTIATGSGTITADGVTWNTGEATAEYEFNSGLLTEKEEYTMETYHVNKDMAYSYSIADEMTTNGTTAIVVKGGTLSVNSTMSSQQLMLDGGKANLNAAVEKGIVANSGSINLGSSATGAVSVSGREVNITGGNSNVELLLSKVTANLDVKESLVTVAGSEVTLNGTLTDGILMVNQAIGAQGDLQLQNSALNVIMAGDASVMDEKTVAAILKDGVVDLGNMGGDARVEVGTYSEQAGFKSSEGFTKYFTNVRLEEGKVVADRNTTYYSGIAGESVSGNGAVGIALADAALAELNPQATAPAGGLAAVLTALDKAGTSEEAEELGASLAGASTAVLGMAVSGDVDRQLQAIRNRTTTMGVDQSVAHEDMPYLNAWINAEGDRSELSESGTEGGYELSSWGGTVGFDADLCPTLTAGLALTAMYGDLDTTGADVASGNIDTYYVSAFARYAPSAWTHTFVATVGKSDISLDRHVAGYELEGETDGLSFGLMYEVGRVFALNEDGTACLQPVFNVAWKHTTVDAYTEDGGDLALEVDEQTLDTVTFGLGARLQAVVGESIYNRTSILEARVLAKADVGDRSGSSDVALAALPEANGSVDSAEMGAFGLEAGAGLTIPVGQEGGSIFMDASVELRSDYTNVNGTVGYRVNF